MFFTGKINNNISHKLNPIQSSSSASTNPSNGMKARTNERFFPSLRWQWRIADKYFKYLLFPAKKLHPAKTTQTKNFSMWKRMWNAYIIFTYTSFAITSTHSSFNKTHSWQSSQFHTKFRFCGVETKKITSSTAN